MASPTRSVWYGQKKKVKIPVILKNESRASFIENNGDTTWMIHTQVISITLNSATVYNMPAL